jgi:hypothetical protein
MNNDAQLIWEALQSNKAFSVVSGGIDNSAEDGFDINPVEYVLATDLKEAVKKMANLLDKKSEEELKAEFDHMKYEHDYFIMSNNNGDFYCVLPGKLSNEQVYDRALAFMKDSEDSEEDAGYASGQVGGRGEEYGTGEVKLLLLRDEKFDCYLHGTVQSVSFHRGTMFHCEPFDGEFYNCESDEYGTIAITPDAHMKILDAPAGSTNTEDEDAENEPHGYPQGMTAIQNLVLNELKKRGFALSKISHADKERDKYPTVFMHKRSGPMHSVVEIDGMGTINGEPYKAYLADLDEKSKRSSGIRPDPEDPYYDTWQSIAQDHAGEDAESVRPSDVSDDIRAKLSQAYSIVKGLIDMLDRTPSGQTPYNEMAITHIVNLEEDVKTLSQMLQDRMLKK